MSLFTDWSSSASFHPFCELFCSERSNRGGSGKTAHMYKMLIVGFCWFHLQTIRFLLDTSHKCMQKSTNVSHVSHAVSLMLLRGILKNIHYIYLETLKTQRFTSAVSFTGLTTCCFLFNILHCHLISNNSRDKHQFTVKRILLRPFILTLPRR